MERLERSGILFCRKIGGMKCHYTLSFYQKEGWQDAGPE